MEWLPHITVATIVEDNGRFLMVEEHKAGRNEVEIELKYFDGTPVIRHWYLVRHKSKRLTPALGAFWDFVVEFAPDYLLRLA